MSEDNNNIDVENINVQPPVMPTPSEPQVLLETFGLDEEYEKK